MHAGLEVPVRVLLSDGSGLTARQCANLLAAAGHVVEVLSPDPLCLCRYTRHVRRVRRVPAYGRDPYGWLDAALAAFAAGRFDVLFPTQEQVAVLSWAAGRLQRAGVTTAVPSFTALTQVQDKISAFATLTRYGLPQPRTSVLDAETVWEEFPVFVKTPIGTATTGVRRVASAPELRRFPRDGGSVLVQAPVEGALVMAQAVFADGEMVACHTSLREQEGASGGASHKRSVDLPEVTAHLSTLGAGLGWHGALSADVILGPDGPVFIDVNPRLVEPANAHLAGVDLVGAMLDVARSGRPGRSPTGRPGVKTHQLLLAVLGAAQHGGRRRDVAAALLAAGLRRGSYRDSVEELTPLRGDPIALVPLVGAAAATLVRPAAWRWFAAGSVANYALTPEAWREITRRSPPDPAGR